VVKSVMMVFSGTRQTIFPPTSPVILGCFAAHAATHCHTLYHAAIHGNALQYMLAMVELHGTARHCNMLYHAASHLSCGAA